MRNRGLVLVGRHAADRRPPRSGAGELRDPREAQAGCRRAAEPVRRHLRPARQADSAREAQVTSTRPNVTVRARTRRMRLSDDRTRRLGLLAVRRWRVGCAGAARRRAGAVPRRRRSRVAERHGHRRPRTTSPTSSEEDFEVFEDGVKQDVTFFNRTQPADRARAAARHQRQHGNKLPTAQEAAIGFAQRLRHAGSRGGHRLRQPGRRSSSRSPTTSPSSSRRSARRRPAARPRSTTPSTSR